MHGDVCTVGLVLSGGGARGLAHIGVLKVLVEAGVPIHLLTGASMGGLIAAAYAAGLAPQQLEAEAMRMRRPRALLSLVDRELPRAGLFDGSRVHDYVTRLLGDITFADLRLPLAVTAVDLVHGEEVVLSDGLVADAVRATVSLPAVFSPVRRGDYLLVDGGVLNNLPVDVARDMGAEVIIAVDVQPDCGAIETEGSGSIFSQWEAAIESLRTCIDIMQRHLTDYKIAQARPEVLIRPALPNSVTTLGGFTRAAEVIAAGVAAAQAALPDIRRCIP